MIPQALSAENLESSFAPKDPPDSWPDIMKRTRTEGIRDSIAPRQPGYYKDMDRASGSLTKGSWSSLNVSRDWKSRRSYPPSMVVVLRII